MTFSSKESQNKFIADYNSKKFTTNELVKKYGFLNNQDLYGTLTTLRKQKLVPESKLSMSIKNYYKNKISNSSNKTAETKTKSVKDSNTPISEYRTVYFKDFSVQIHKKAMARLVVDHNNNLHILNS